jgi:hypothetical protein
MREHVSGEKCIMRCLMICTAHPKISVNKIEKNKFGGACSMQVDWRVVYRILVGKTEGNAPFGRPKPRWDNFIKMDFQEVRCSGMS